MFSNVETTIQMLVVGMLGSLLVLALSREFGNSVYRAFFRDYIPSFAINPRKSVGTTILRDLKSSRLARVSRCTFRAVLRF